MMPTAMRALLRLTVLALAAMTTTSCLSPTLPLPPPAEPDNIELGTATGAWDIGGICIPGAIVTVFNKNTGRGVVVEDLGNTGVYVVSLGGTLCDTAWVEQQNDQGESAQTTFVLQGFTNGLPDDPSLCH